MNEKMRIVSLLAAALGSLGLYLYFENLAIFSYLGAGVLDANLLHFYNLQMVEFYQVAGLVDVLFPLRYGLLGLIPYWLYLLLLLSALVFLMLFHLERFWLITGLLLLAPFLFFKQAVLLHCILAIMLVWGSLRYRWLALVALLFFTPSIFALLLSRLLGRRGALWAMFASFFFLVIFYRNIISALYSISHHLSVSIDPYLYFIPVLILTAPLAILTRRRLGDGVALALVLLINVFTLYNLFSNTGKKALFSVAVKPGATYLVADYDLDYLAIPDSGIGRLEIVNLGLAPGLLRQQLADRLLPDFFLHFLKVEDSRATSLWQQLSEKKELVMIKRSSKDFESHPAKEQAPFSRGYYWYNERKDDITVIEF